MPFTDIEAVLFDLDGTLLHSRIDFARMRREVLEQVEAAGLSAEEYRGQDILGILTAASKRLPSPVEFLLRADEALVEIELEASAEAYEAEGATETLQWLIDSGFKVGIVTRNSRQAVDTLFRGFPLPHHVLLTRADTPRVKPDPLHLELALNQLGVPAARAVMVGDHLMDVLGGKAAGTRTLGILSPERPATFFDEVAPDGVLRSLPELRSWISP
jgi:phosphoglycolate phosphatase